MKKWTQKQRDRLKRRIAGYEDGLSNKMLSDKIQKSFHKPGSQKKG